MRRGAVNSGGTRGLVFCPTGFVVEAITDGGYDRLRRADAGEWGCHEGYSSDQTDTGRDGGVFG